jgi:hypothetical protein
VQIAADLGFQARPPVQPPIFGNRQSTQLAIVNQATLKYRGLSLEDKIDLMLVKLDQLLEMKQG